MADSTTNLQHFVLYDLWPGVPDQRLSVPTGGFTGATHHGVATAAYPVGTKIQVYNTGTTGRAGWATFIYLKLEMEDATTTVEAKSLLAQHTDAIDGTAGSFYDVTNEVASILTTGVGPVAYCLNDWTVDTFGWAWCGGVAPTEFVAAITGTVNTLGTVAVGPVGWGNLATSTTAGGELGLEVMSAVTETCIGCASHIDPSD